MATSPLFVANHRNTSVDLITQILARDGVTGADVDLFVAGSKGSLVEQIYAQAQGIMGENLLRIFHTPVGGTTSLLLEAALATVATAPPTTAITGYPVFALLPPLLLPTLAAQRGIRLAAGATLSVALGATSVLPITVHCLASDY